MGRRLRNNLETEDDPMLKDRYSQLGKWLRMQKTVRKWTPVQRAYDEAYKAARESGKSDKQAHLKAKSDVMKAFPWVQERNLGRDTGRGIVPYD
jgi:hypothetical protein